MTIEINDMVLSCKMEMERLDICEKEAHENGEKEEIDAKEPIASQRKEVSEIQLLVDALKKRIYEYETSAKY